MADVGSAVGGMIGLAIGTAFAVYALQELNELKDKKRKKKKRYYDDSFGGVF